MIDRDRERMVYRRQKYLRDIEILKNNPFTKDWQKHYDRATRNLKLVTAKLANLEG